MEAATQMLKRAVDLDTLDKLPEAKVCYEEGIELLMKELKNINDENRRTQVRNKIATYMKRAEELKIHLQNIKTLWKVSETIEIKENQRGCSYSTLFSKFINDKLTCVRIQDSYIRRQHQIFNLLRFCELLVKKGKSVRKIDVFTGRAGGENPQQHNKLQMLSSNLAEYGVTMTINYSETIHDREIVFDNGWVIKIGRGLDYFKKTKDSTTIGFCDHDLRECLETNIDVYDTR